MTRSLVWFRGKDLRVDDHAALVQAAREGEVIPVFVLDSYFFEPERARTLPHRMQFLLESLRELQSSLAALGSELLLLSGRAIERIPEIAEKLAVDQVLALRWSEPFGRKRDRIVEARLAKLGVPFVLHEGELLRPPGSVRTGGGTPFRVFTPFARAHLKAGPPDAPLRAPRSLPPLPRGAKALSDARIPTLATLGIEHNPRLVRGGEKAAHTRLADFLAEASGYVRARDDMASTGTSRLSQDHKFGTLSVRRVWERASDTLGGATLERFQLELLWRSFHYENLWHRPELLAEPFHREFAGFPWREDLPAFQAWQRGETGYPLVDAASRQLLREGYVHNRARMIAASFVCKHLLLPYWWGEAHYMKYLVDGDWAQNNGNWQWSAGCGCDAQPYFRVFNPVSQGAKFDRAGDYVRRYVPELRTLDAKYIHSPWLAPAAVLHAAGVQLGTSYPRPLVDHAKARTRFLETAKQHLRKT